MRAVWTERIAPRLASDRGLWLGLFGLCVVVYAITASWAYQGDDTIASAWPAWSLVHRGTLDVSGIQGLPGSEWFVHVHGQLLSNRMIGVIAAGVPVNALLGWTGLAAPAAAALTSVLCAAATVATIAIVLRPLVGRSWAVAAAAVTGFGTAIWTVSSKELWTHTPDGLWLSLALLGLSRRRYLLAGLVFAPAVMTRPHLVVAAGVIAVVMAVFTRSPATLVKLGAPAAAGLGGLAAANHAIYGSWSLSGGYGLVGYSVSDKAAISGGTGMVVDLAQNVAGALVSPLCGVLLYSPIVILGLLALPAGWRSAPLWTKAAAAGGAAYEIAQCKVNVYTGGAGFFSNRLIIECVILFVPLLACSLRSWSAASEARRTAVVTAGAVSIAIHMIGAFVPSLPRPRGSGWHNWYLLEVLRHGGTAAPVMAVVALASVALVVAGWTGRDREPLSVRRAVPA